MFGLTTTRRLRKTQRENVGLHARLGLLQGFHQSETTALRRAEQCLSDEIDAHILTIRARHTAEDALATEQRTTRLLAEQLLVATSEKNPAARAALGLPEEGPWDRAVEGLNALVDADIAFHIEPDGHISNPLGDEHIEWDREANRWRLVHDDETDTTEEAG